MTIVSGIQPSGKLHVGNALGAVRKWLALQEEHSAMPYPPASPELRRAGPSPPLPAGGGGSNGGCFFFIADWHSLTEQYDAQAKAAQVRELAAELMALGVDPARVALFRQSDVAAHLELAWYFACVTPMAELQRMTQYKDKVGHGEHTNVGLFTYPVLMAADILAYSSQLQPTNSKHTPSSSPSGRGGEKKGGVGVPVGDDQRQHLELANDVVRWFNNRYGETFTPITGLHTGTARIMSLKDPTRKMSKSAGDAHCLFLDDAPAVVQKKIKAAVTDTAPTPSSSPSRREEENQMSPGVATLFTILEAYADAGTVAQFRAQQDAGTLKYSALKPAVAQAFSDAHATFRERKAELLADPDAIERALATGAERARAVAELTLATVRAAVGIR